MIVLDTNVLSELMRKQPAPGVVAWVGAITATRLFVSAVTEAEILYGISMLQPGDRRDHLNRLARQMFDEDFAGRRLSFDSAAAVEYATIAATRRIAGRPIQTADAQIAAIARSRGGSVATRNVADFQGCGVQLINPWG